MKKTQKLRERDIEEYLVKQVAKLGGKCYKWQSMNNKAVPDRLCFFPKGVFVIVECKAPGKTPTPLQYKVIRSIRLMDHEVLIIDSKEMVDIFVESVKEVLDGK